MLLDRRDLLSGQAICACIDAPVTIYRKFKEQPSKMQRLHAELGGGILKVPSAVKTIELSQPPRWRCQFPSHTEEADGIQKKASQFCVGNRLDDRYSILVPLPILSPSNPSLKPIRLAEKLANCIWASPEGIERNMQ
jgi:hypothetical protein